MSVIGNAILLGGKTFPDAGGVSFGGVYAFIRVTYPSGSTCTCTNGTTTLTAEDTSGSYTFAVEAPASGTDTWTVSCTDGNDSTSASVSVSNSGGFYNTELAYAIIYTLTLDTNGGAWPDGTTTRTYRGAEGTTVNLATDVPYYEDRSFIGWNRTGGGSYNELTKIYTFGSSDGLMTARWMR